MAKGSMTKAQGHRSNKLRGYYERQYHITDRNKTRRAIARKKRKEMWLKRGVKKNGQRVCPAS